MPNDMTGAERISRTLVGQSPDRTSILPILHSAFPALQGVRLGQYYSDATTLAAVTVRAAREFAMDGVQLTTGVTMEAEALGAAVEQPADGAAILRQHLLPDLHDLSPIHRQDPTRGGRAPLFHDALSRVVREIGGQTFVLATLRGPLLMASQLREVQTLLMDMIDAPEAVEKLLDATTDIAIKMGKWLLSSGAHGLVCGEATCSPNFIAPSMYREMVLPRHRRLISELKAAGWQTLGFHVCGNTLPILDDLISTGADLLDIDYQVPAEKALQQAASRVTLRGNLDPASVLRFGTPQQIIEATEKLVQTVRGQRWILSSGCDIPPGTSRENLQAFFAAARSA